MWLRTTSCRVFADSFKPLLPSPYLSSTPSPVVTLCLSPTPALLNLGTECPPLITQNVNIKLQYLKQTRSLNTRGLMITEKKKATPTHTRTPSEVDTVTPKLHGSSSFMAVSLPLRGKARFKGRQPQGPQGQDPVSRGSRPYRSVATLVPVTGFRYPWSGSSGSSFGLSVITSTAAARYVRKPRRLFTSLPPLRPHFVISQPRGKKEGECLGTTCRESKTTVA